MGNTFHHLVISYKDAFDAHYTPAVIQGTSFPEEEITYEFNASQRVYNPQGRTMPKLSSELTPILEHSETEDSE